MFISAVKLTRNPEKGEFTYNGWGMAFDGKGYWSFDITIDY